MVDCNAAIAGGALTEFDESLEVDGHYLPYDLDPSESLVKIGATDTRTPAERTADLFSRMNSHRKVLMGILDYCREPRLVHDVDALVDRLKKSNPSVFTSANLCNLLEKAGALDSVGGEQVEPEVVEIDGVSYLKPVKTRPEDMSWQTNQVGLDFLTCDAPLERFRSLLEEDAPYKHIYLIILECCANEGGATAKELGDAVDDDPALQEPRMYAPYFFNRLSECDLLAWTGSWTVTNFGREAVSMLEDEVRAR